MAKLVKDAVEQHIKRFDTLKSDRGTLDNHLQEIARRVYPEHATFTTTRVEGEKMMKDVFDPTAIHANQLLSAGLFSLLTSSANPWFGIAPVNAEDLENFSIVSYLSYISRVMYHEINKAEAGFSTAAHECYLSYGAFGNFCMFADENINAGHLLFLNLPMSECYFVQNAQDRVDTLYRKYTRKVQYLIDKFGIENLSPDTQKLAADGKLDEYIPCTHVIAPREIANLMSPKSTDMPFLSAYIENKSRFLMREGGYPELPFMGTRFYKTGGSTYGYGPGQTSLPDIKMLMRAMQVTIRAAQKRVDPTIMLPDQGFLKPFRSNPSGINYYRKGRMNLKNDMDILPSGDPELGEAFCESIRNRIREMFFVDQLQLSEGPQMTATEVMQRTEEKLRLMGPLLGRVQPEFLGPLIQRVFGQLQRAGKFPEPPPELADVPLKIVYTSPIARAQEQVQANGLLRSFEILREVWERDPASVDILNSDELTKGVFEMFSVNPKFINSDKDVKATRTARAEAEKKKAMAENIGKLGPGIAGMGQASDTPLGEKMMEQQGTTGEGQFLQ